MDEDRSNTEHGDAKPIRVSSPSSDLRDSSIVAAQLAVETATTAATAARVAAETASTAAATAATIAARVAAETAAIAAAAATAAVAAAALTKEVIPPTARISASAVIIIVTILSFGVIGCMALFIWLCFQYPSSASTVLPLLVPTVVGGVCAFYGKKLSARLTNKKEAPPNGDSTISSKL